MTTTTQDQLAALAYLTGDTQLGRSRASSAIDIIREALAELAELRARYPE